jgi:hypothetical protein
VKEAAITSIKSSQTVTDCCWKEWQSLEINNLEAVVSGIPLNNY